MPKTQDPQAELAALHASIAKKFGATSFHKASDSMPVNRVPFWEPQLNYASHGGVPFGRWSSLVGRPMSGKSRVAMEIVAQAQQLPRSAEVVLIPRIAYHSALSDETSLDGEVRRKHEVKAEHLTQELEWARETFPHGAEAVLYDVEAQFDKKWAAQLGVDLDRLFIFESTTIEEIGEVAQGLFPHYPIHVIDSTTNASSIYIQKEDIGKASYGRNKLQWKVCLMGAGTTWDRERNIGVMIHQMSTNVKTGGLKSTSSTYMDHLSRLSLYFYYGKDLWLKDGVLTDAKTIGIDETALAGSAPVDGRQVYVKVEKCSTGRPGLIGGLQWSYRKETFVTVHELASAALYYGIARKSVSWYAIDGEDGNVGQGLRSLYARLADDEDLRERVVCRLMDRVSDDDG